MIDKPQAASRKPQAASRKPQAASRKPQAASRNSRSLSGNRRLLLFAGRTSQALARLRYDVEPLFSPDPRLTIAYTLIPGSRFESGAPDFAHRNDIELLPWSTARTLAPDLVVTASPDPCLYEADAPVLTLPHGAGHNRLRPELSGVSGLSPEQIQGPEGQVPDFMALPGPAALTRLAIDCPAAVPHAEVCGDVCLERLRASTAQRDAYREALGVEGRNLILLSSSWDATALGRKAETLPERLHAELPLDDFALAYIPHPNDDLTAPSRLTGLLHPQLQNGLIMIPPDEGWRAALVAADCIIGDHGSVTFFGATIGLPVLLATFGFANMPPELPLARFGRTAPRFNQAKPAAPQLREAIARGPVEFDYAAALAEPTPGPATRLATAAYRLLNLAPPAPPAPPAVPLPAQLPQCRPTYSWRWAPNGSNGTRYPISIPTTIPDYRDGHLVADTATPDPRLRNAANVILSHTQPTTVDKAITATRTLLQRHPISRVASTRIKAPAYNTTSPQTDDQAHAIVITRDGPAFQVEANATQLDAIPSAIYDHLVRGTLNPTPEIPDLTKVLAQTFNPPPTLTPIENQP
ncbi:hypothetical protein AB0B28_02855 [Glycomyces sp. NPDC046736]|uniref:hypothetical protein n=1 Tax=Glycomyces sp. NPDC046736 TaxID=3155615 RepID=UPI0033F7CDA8